MQKIHLKYIFNYNKELNRYPQGRIQYMQLRGGGGACFTKSAKWRKDNAFWEYFVFHLIKERRGKHRTITNFYYDFFSRKDVCSVPVQIELYNNVTRTLGTI